MTAQDSLPVIVPARRAPGGRDVPVALVSLVTLGLLVLLWATASARGWTTPLFLPGPAAVAQAAWEVATRGFVDATLLQHLGASLGRMAAGLAAALGVGAPVGAAIALSPVARGILDPLVEMLRPLPPLAYLPLVIIWFGIGEASKVLVIALAMLPPIVIATAQGVRATDRDRINAARALGASGGQVLWLVVAPSALPQILTGIRIAVGAGWATLVAAELIAATRGLGFMIQAAGQFLVTDVVIVGIVVIAAVATALEAALRALERRLVPWSTSL